ncbi:amino acid ABC transporter permease [Nocardioides terrisoli]
MTTIEPIRGARVASGTSTSWNEAKRFAVVPAPHPGRRVLMVVSAVLAAGLVTTLVTNPRYQWGTVNEYLFAPQILRGLRMTIVLTVVSMAIGIALGIVLAVIRLSPSRLASGLAGAYIAFFRGTPVLVQLIFWFNLSALYPKVAVGIPFGPEFFLVNVNVLVTPFVAAVLTLVLNEGAYMAEIVRSGILSVPEGQTYAATSLGLSRLRTMRWIVLPQAMRVIVPPTGNDVISMLKTTSIVSIIALSELLYSAQAIYTRTYETIPLLIAVSIWYLVATSVLTLGQQYLERRFGRGTSRTVATGKWAVLRNVFSTRRPKVAVQ